MDAKEKVCFIIMPISDIEGYEPGHFKRVYEYIIKPACKNAGFTPIRADDIKKTNVIVIDILQKLLNSDMAVCDLSGKNPNVLYELGIRQSFDLPVSFIKDEITTRVFDIQGFRDLEYNSSLRIDEVNSAIEMLTLNITETFESKGQDVNSIVELLGISKAKVTKQVEISPDTDLILKSLNDISLRLGDLENKYKPKELEIIANDPIKKREPVTSYEFNGEVYKINDKVKHDRFGIGTIIGAEYDKSEGPIVTINFDSLGKKQLLVKFAKITKEKG
ncbi:MAG TPA: hypothetical protein VIJ27_13465 [Mucilaginibacter sp.]